MATAIIISLTEYLNTSYRPDREYLDGEIVERNMLVPAAFVLAVHVAGFIPLYLLNHIDRAVSIPKTWTFQNRTDTRVSRTSLSHCTQ